MNELGIAALAMQRDSTLSARDKHFERLSTPRIAILTVTYYLQSGGPVEAPLREQCAPT